MDAEEFTLLDEKTKRGETTAEEDKRYDYLALLMAEKQVEDFHFSSDREKLLWHELMGASQFKTAQSHIEATSQTH